MFGRKNKHSKNPIDEYTKILNICKSRTNLLEKLLNIDRKMSADKIELTYQIGLIQIASQPEHILTSTKWLLNVLYSKKFRELENINIYRNKRDKLWWHIQNNFDNKMKKLDTISASMLK